MKPKSSIYEFDAIGTHWWIEALGGQILSDVIRQSIDSYVLEFTRRYSRFDEDSLISQLNKYKRVENPPPELLEMFAYGKEMHELTNGIFNISVSGTLHGLGYGSRSKVNRPDPHIWNHITMSKKAVTIPANITIDIDGFGKGWMIDEIGEMLERHGATHFIINGGGDILVKSDKPIKIALEHPTDTNLSVGYAYLQNEALAASSTVKRAWQHNGSTYHHIIDPRTGLPTENDTIASYIKAPTALMADTLATVLLVEPSLEAMLKERFGIKTIILKAHQFKT